MSNNALGGSVLGDPYPFSIVDAFTSEPLAGNPCAVVLDAGGLDEATMQALARETNLSETAFVVRDSKGQNSFRARYFTPESEIPFAGHPTVATVRALVDAGRVEVERGKAEVGLALPAGAVDVEVSREEQHLRFTMTQRPPEWGRIYEPSPVAAAFGLNVDEILGHPPIQTVSTGTPMLMIRVSGMDALRRARMDFDAYRTLRDQGDFFSPHLYCLPGISQDALTFARHFGLPPDTLEDPFTGSATGAMAAHLCRHGLLEEPCFVAEQGHWMGRPGRAFVEVQGSASEVQRVRVGGEAVTVIEGALSMSGRRPGGKQSDVVTTQLVKFEVADPTSDDARYCIQAYFNELDRRFEGGFDPGHSVSTDIDELTEPDGLLLLARLHGEPIACGALTFHEDEPAHLRRMWVDPSARGLGLGRRLLAELEERARRGDVTTVRLETNRALSEAISLYRSAGYEEVEPFNDEPCADHWFEKELASNPGGGA